VDANLTYLDSFNIHNVMLLESFDWIYQMHVFYKAIAFLTHIYVYILCSVA